MGLKVLFFTTSLFLSFAVIGKTIVIVENKTSLKLHFSTVQSGYKLGINKWSPLSPVIEAGQTGPILEFNRDSGIKNGKEFQFNTEVRGPESTEPTLKLHQFLRGKSINSHLWQSASSGNRKITWNDTRETKYISALIDGKHLRVSFNAFADGTDDNVIYTIQEIKVKNIGESENQLSILNYNIYMRPIAVFKNGQLIRAELLPEVLKGNDVINFSEAFDDDARELLLKNLLWQYPYSTKVVGTDIGFKQDGGVVILSRWPIVEEDEYLFGELCFKDFEDCLSNKGIGYAKILKGSKFYHIFATHMQAGYTAKDKSVRRAQLQKLKQFIDSKEISKDEPVIITGDFNINRMELDQEKNSDYPFMLKTLNAEGLPHIGHKYSFDPTLNKLGKSSEPSELVEHVMTSKDHQRPLMGSQRVLMVKSKEPWREFGWEDLISDLSDHFPLRAELQF